mgnify:FL=1
MKYLLGLFFIIAIPAFSKEGKNPNLIQLENNMTLDCTKYGNDSCSARFLAMAGCTYAMGINSGKSAGESMEIGSELFVAMMKGHNLSASNMFDKENNLKKSIKRETIERFRFCEEEIVKSVQILYEKKNGKIPDNDLTRKLIKGFVWWFIDEFELTKKQLKVIQN